jgi:hypothetical protein
MPHKSIEANRKYQREWKRQWQKKNPGKGAEQARRWRLANPGRAKLANDRFRAKNRVRRNAEKREWAKAHPGHYRAHNMMHCYGLTLQQIDDIRLSQDNQCAICSQVFIPASVMRVDHDHATGKVRGLLCNRCNVALGIFGDTIQGVERVIEYLKRAS